MRAVTHPCPKAAGLKPTTPMSTANEARRLLGRQENAMNPQVWLMYCAHCCKKGLDEKFSGTKCRLSVVNRRFCQASGLNLPTTAAREEGTSSPVGRSGFLRGASRISKVPPSGGWKAARTRTLESVRYVAQPFQALVGGAFQLRNRCLLAAGLGGSFTPTQRCEITASSSRRERIRSARPPARGSPGAR